MSRACSHCNQRHPSLACRSRSYHYLDLLFFPLINTYIGAVCIDFYYHMFGRDVNTLKIIRHHDSRPAVIFLRANNQGNQWNRESVEVFLQQGTKLQVSAARASGNFGDIAIDKIKITQWRCK